LSGIEELRAAGISQTGDCNVDGLLISILKRRRREFVRRFPQVACFAFDFISTEIAVRGRVDRDELNCLSSQLFNRMTTRRICLDIGANIGNHSLVFAEHFDRVLAFEPNPRTFKLLAINSELARNIVPYRLGASNRKGTMTAYQDALNLGATTTSRTISSHREENQKGVISTVQFDVDRLDDFLGESDLNQVDFIKLDVEGHEAAALDGMGNILRGSSPIIAMEAFSDSFSDGKSQSVEILKSHGYRSFYCISGGSSRSTKLPKPIRKLNRRAWKLIGRDRQKYALTRIDDVVPRYHHMLVCSKHDVV
jgi:FkbM family methyltransferase